MQAHTALISAVLFSLTLTSGVANGQVATLAQPQVRIKQAVSDSNAVTLMGNVHPLIGSASTSVPADLGTPMTHLVLSLEASPAQEAQLEQLIAKQSDPKSANYHKYLTPAAFAAQYGVAAADIATVSGWLQSHGFKVEQVAAGGRSITFSGNAAQVNKAFQTEMRQYTIGGVQHLANATDPKIPAAFAGTVGGVLKLHDFQSQPNLIKGTTMTPLADSAPAFSPSGLRMLVPADYYTIYDINPLLGAGIDGTGQSIAVLARSNIYASDIQGFRTLTGLKANNPTVIVTNNDPGIQGDDNIETTLDTEWAGATAPGASVKVIVSSSASSTDGIQLSAIYAVNNNVAPIITLSYGSCEAAMGATELAFYNSLWKQASAQGQTVLVASGDSGAAGCDSSGAATATNGKGVNGLCSSPYATCVGGTEFVEGANPGQYWLPLGLDSTLNSAIGYIPESVWNESGSSNGALSIWAGGGGASNVYAKPSWQTGAGVPADGKRDVPDVALTAAEHDSYTVVQGGYIGYIFGVGGTSAATPSFAGIMALVNQKNGSAQGNINSILYPLAAKQVAGGAAIFHDITTGNNSVPGVAGYSATAGYDLASGLGSVDANLLVNLWNYASGQAPPLSVYASATSVKVGQTGSTTVTTVTNGIKSAVALAVSGLPSGVTATFSTTSIASPGSGSSTLKFTASASAVAGTYPITLTATAGTTKATSSFELTVAQPTFTLHYGGGLYPMVIFGPNAPFVSQQIPFAVYPSNGFNSTVTMTAAGLPSGMTVTFSPATFSGATVTSTTATVAIPNSFKGGSYNFTISASGGGVTQTVKYLAIVDVQPSCALTPDQYSTNFNAGGGATIMFSCTSATKNTNPVTISIAGAPGGATAKFASSTISAGGRVALNLTSLSSVAPGTYPLTVTGTEPDGATQNISIYAAIGVPVFALSLNPATVTAVAGSTAQFTAVITPDKGFATPVTIWIGSRPVGVSATFSPTTVANPSSTITLTLDKTTLPGTYPLTIGANANSGFQRIIVSTLTVVGAPACSLASGLSTLSVAPGKTTTAQVTCAITKGTFIAPLSLSLAGLPTGVTGQFNPTTLTAGSSTTLTLTGASTAAIGTSSVSLTGSGSGYTQTIQLPLTVAQPSIAISSSVPTVTMKAGGSATVTLTSKTSGGFTSAVMLTAGGLPTGVTASLSTANVAAPGNGSVTMTLKAASSAKTGTYRIATEASGGGLSANGVVTVTITN